MSLTGTKLSEAEHAIDAAKSNYLRSFGWEQTCATPGSYWLWRRDFTAVDKRYGVMTVPTDLAVSMTLRVLDDQSEDDDS